jgi:hypothetical protein
MPGAPAEQLSVLPCLSITSVFRRADRTAWQTFDNRVVVLDIPARTMLGLNPTAAQVWQELDGERDLESIARLIADKHGQPSPEVCRDVIAFVQELLDRACVEHVKTG